MKPLIKPFRPEPGRRIAVISDIHGNLPFLEGLLGKIGFCTNDILILLGDLLEKGAQSLELARYVMDLQKTYTVHCVCGNCDGYVLRFLESGAWDQRFFSWFLPQHPESILRQMAREGGFEQWEDFSRLRADLRRTYPEVWAWLREMPTILEGEHFVFVHGGVPSLTHMEDLDGWKCMKNDDFLGQGLRFDKWVVVGHWPTTLYREKIPSSAPIILPDRKIISIDGACVLKLDGQLNALLIPEDGSQDFSWTCWDGLPQYTALDSQPASPDSINIRWGRSRVEILEQGGEFTRCRHLESGRELDILTRFLRQGKDGPWCEDCTDYCLPVSAGEVLSVSEVTSRGVLAKKNGVTGWYSGRLGPEITQR